MKKLFLPLAVAALLAINGFVQTKIPIDEISKHIGEIVTVCDKVYSPASRCASLCFKRMVQRVSLRAGKTKRFRGNKQSQKRTE